MKTVERGLLIMRIESYDNIYYVNLHKSVQPPLSKNVTYYNGV
jgi:hypothetical protein